MKKKILLIPLALLLIVSLLACAAPAPAPVPAPAPAPAPTPVPVLEPQTWSYLIFNATTGNPEDVEVQLAFDRIKERTNGLLDIKVVPNGALPIKSQDQLRAVSGGQLEMCIGNTGYHMGDFPAYKLLGIPYIYSDEVEKVKFVYATLPIVEREMNKFNVHVLSYRPQTPNGLFLTEAVDNPMDLGKRRLRTYGASNVNVLEALDATPVMIAWAETHTALERGTVAGVCTGMDSICNVKMHEVCPYGYNVHYLATPYHIVINKELWESLPRDVQDIVIYELNQAQTVNMARLPYIHEEVVSTMLATGLKSWTEETPPGLDEHMQERVAKPLLMEAVQELGPLGEELLNAIEVALGRELL